MNFSFDHIYFLNIVYIRYLDLNWSISNKQLAYTNFNGYAGLTSRTWLKSDRAYFGFLFLIRLTQPMDADGSRHAKCHVFKN